MKNLRFGAIALFSLLLLGLLFIASPAHPAPARLFTHVSNFRLLGKTGTVTCKGFFINITGSRVGVSFTSTINAAGGTPKSFADLYGSDLPDGASGAKVNLSGDVYFDNAPAPPSGTDDFAVNYANYPWVIAEPDFNNFGRGEF